jgi:hypothetical protein
MRSAIRTLAAIALAVGPFGAHADQIRKSSERLPDTENRKSLGSFSAQLILVPDDQQMFKLWDTPAETVSFSTIQSVSVGGQANAFVVFSGCAPNKSDHCDVTMRFRVYQPNGKLYATTPPLEVWQYKAAPPDRTLQLSVQYLKVVIEPQDLLGKYIISVNVRDHVSGASLQLSTVFTTTK